MGVWSTGLLFMAPWRCHQCNTGTGLAGSDTQLWDRVKARNLIWNQSVGDEFLLTLILLIPKKPTAKFLLASTDAELSSGSTDRIKESPCLMSCLKCLCLMVFGIHWASCICYSNSFEDSMMQVLNLHRRKIPVMVNNKEPEEPWGQQLCFPAQHAISQTLEFLES